MELVDDSFKKPGAIPFKWEIRPGVPKLQQYYDVEEFSSFSETPRKLTPPPSAAGYCSQTGSSFRSTPPSRSGSSRSRSFRFYSSNNHPQPQQQQQRRNVGVSSTTTSGCFPSPLLIKRRSEKNKTKKKHKITSKEETASNSDVETLSPRLSVSNSSSWKSLSPLPDSPFSSSFSSYFNYYSTPPTLTPGRRLGKVSSKDAADWAGFGLF